MRNIALHLSFDGSSYHGWQVQKNAVTVQQTVQDSIENVFGIRLGLTGCSRTDAGVHAKDYVCCFKTSSGIAADGIMRALNANLPNDIAVRDCADVPMDFHPRYSAVGKEYVYRICNLPYRDPFSRPYSFFYPKHLDCGRMNNAASAFIGKHDFESFHSIGSSPRERPGESGTTVRTIYKSEILKSGGTIIYRISGDGFLYNMVRIIVGTLIFSCGGKADAQNVKAIIDAKSRKSAGPTAPAQGLCLNRVFYDADSMLKRRTPDNLTEYFT